MEGEYNQIFNVGHRLILELKSREIYEGLYADGGKDRITLTEVVQHNNKNKLGDLYDFYRTEISKIHTLKAPPSKLASPEVAKSKNVATDSKIVQISEEEYFRLKDMSKSYIYLENADKRYFDAVDLLKESETVGVLALGMEKHRSGSLIRLLVLCSWKQVFIFDIANCEKRQLYSELREILESEYVCKVIHKGAGLADVLFRQYNVYVQNVFDTHIIDLMLQKSDKRNNVLVERDVSECLAHYLNFPSCLFENAQSVPCKKWIERPLSDEKKLYASQLVTYLIVLKDHFQKILLNKIYSTTNKVYDFVYDLNDFDFNKYVRSEKEMPQELQDIIPRLDNFDI